MMDPADDPRNDPGPFTAMDEVEVVGQFRRDAQEKLKQSERILQDAALRAIIQGHDPREVAAQCGFGEMPRQGGNIIFDEEDAVVPNMRQMLFGGFLVEQQPQQNDMQLFTQWLGRRLQEIVREGWAR